MENRSRWRRAGRHVLPLAYCAVLAIGLTWPLARDPSAGLLGRGVGDNVTFLWNVWWARTALTDPGASLLWTGALFAPIGTSLVLHTATFLPSVAAALLPLGSLVSSLNLIVIGTVWLNAVSAYVAAYRLTGQRLPSVIAGTAFAAAPFLTVRLEGHLNVLSAWPLPLVVAAFDELCSTPRVVQALLLSVRGGARLYGLLRPRVRRRTDCGLDGVPPVRAARHLDACSVGDPKSADGSRPRAARPGGRGERVGRSDRRRGAVRCGMACPHALQLQPENGGVGAGHRGAGALEDARRPPDEAAGLDASSILAAGCRVSGGCARADRALAGRRGACLGGRRLLGSGTQVAKRDPGDRPGVALPRESVAPASRRSGHASLLALRD